MSSLATLRSSSKSSLLLKPRTHFRFDITEIPLSLVFTEGAEIVKELITFVVHFTMLPPYNALYTPFIHLSYYVYAIEMFTVFDIEINIPTKYVRPGFNPKFILYNPYPFKII